MFALLVLVSPSFVLAADTIAPVYDEIGNQLGAAAGQQGAGLELQDTRVIVAGAIRYGLGFVGILFVALMVYAGVLWMTAGGNEDQVGKAKKLIFQAMIGLVVVFSAYSITIVAYRVASGKYTADACRSSSGGSIDSADCQVSN